MSDLFTEIDEQIERKKGKKQEEESPDIFTEVDAAIERRQNAVASAADLAVATAPMDEPPTPATLPAPVMEDVGDIQTPVRDMVYRPELGEFIPDPHAEALAIQEQERQALMAESEKRSRDFAFQREQGWGRMRRQIKGEIPYMRDEPYYQTLTSELIKSVKDEGLKDATYLAGVMARPWERGFYGAKQFFDGVIWNEMGNALADIEGMEVLGNMLKYFGSYNIDKWNPDKHGAVTPIINEEEMKLREELRAIHPSAEALQDIGNMGADLAAWFTINKGLGGKYVEPSKSWKYFKDVAVQLGRPGLMRFITTPGADLGERVEAAKTIMTYHATPQVTKLLSIPFPFIRGYLAASTDFVLNTYLSKDVYEQAYDPEKGAMDITFLSKVAPTLMQDLAMSIHTRGMMSREKKGLLKKVWRSKDPKFRDAFGNSFKEYYKFMEEATKRVNQDLSPDQVEANAYREEMAKKIDALREKYPEYDEMWKEGSLQFFAEDAPPPPPDALKESLYAETIERSELPTRGEDIARYEQTNRERQLTEAAARYEADGSARASYERLMDKENWDDADSVLSVTIQKELYDTGYAEKAKKLANRQAEQLRTGGQLVETGKHLNEFGKDTPSTVKAAESIYDEYKGKNPKKVAHTEREAKEAKATLDQINADALEQAIADLESKYQALLNARAREGQRERKGGRPPAKDKVTKEAHNKAMQALRDKHKEQLFIVRELQRVARAEERQKGDVRVLEEREKARLKLQEEKAKLKNLQQRLKDQDVDIELQEAGTKPLTPEEILARKIHDGARDKDPKNDPLRDMLNTLHKVAKQVIPNPENIPKDPLEFMRQAIKNREQYAQVYQQAKQILRQKYAKSPEKWAEVEAKLQEYFEFEPGKYFPDSMLDNAIKAEMKEAGIDIKELVRQHYTYVDKYGDTLKEKLIEKMGLSEVEAERLAKYIESRFGTITKDAKAKALNTLLGQKGAKGLVGMGAKEKKTYIERLIELSNLGALEDAQYYEVLADRYGIPTADPALVKQIHEKVQKLQTMEEGRAKDVAQAELLKMIEDEIPIGAARQISTLQLIHQLFSVKTALRNILGNAGYAAYDGVMRAAIGVPIDMVIAKFITGKRTTAAFDPRVYAKGFAEQGIKGAYDVWHGIDTTGFELTRESGKQQQAIYSKHEIRGQTFKSKANPYYWAEKLTGISLKATDRAFFGGAYRASLDEQLRVAKLNGLDIDRPTPEMHQSAIVEGLIKTYQQDSHLAQGASGLKRLLNNLLGFGGKEYFTGEEKRKAWFQGRDFGLGDIVIKYPKTPANIILTAFNNSPAALSKALYYVIKSGQARYYTGKWEWPGQKQIVRDIYETGGGSILWALGWWLGTKGVVSGLDPDPTGKMAQTEEALEKKDFQFNVSKMMRMMFTGGDQELALQDQEGDWLITYDQLLPLSIPMAMGATFAENAARNESIRMQKQRELYGTNKPEEEIDWLYANYAAAMEAAGAGIEVMAGQSLIKGLITPLRPKKTADQISQVAKNVPTSFIPQLVSQYRYITDPTLRNYKVDEAEEGVKLFTEMGNLAMNKLSWMQDNLPAKYDVLGKKKEIWTSESESPLGTLLNILYTTSSPVNIARYQKEPGIELALSLYRQVPDPRLLPQDVTKSRTLTFGNISIPITAQEADYYQVVLGNETRERLNRLATSGKLDSPDVDVGDKATMVIEEIKNAGKATALTMIQDMAKAYGKAETLRRLRISKKTLAMMLREREKLNEGNK